MIDKALADVVEVANSLATTPYRARNEQIS